MSWRHFVLAALVAGPALALGGVPPVVTMAFVPLVGVLFLGSIIEGKKSSRRVPIESFLMLGLAAWTLLAAFWLPSGLVNLIAGPLAEAQSAAGEGPANLVSVIPGSTRLEAAKWAALGGLFAYCSWSRWRVVAALVAMLSAAVALIGIAQLSTGQTEILGFYAPQDFGSRRGPVFLTTFVNVNHQGALFLLGSVCSLALVVDSLVVARKATDQDAARARLDRVIAASGALVMSVVGIALSASRSSLIVAAVALPLAFWLGFRVDERRRIRRHVRRRLAMLAGGLVVVLAMAASLGAWKQLTSGWDRGAVDAKFASAVESIALVRWSPILGIGRGTFVDVYPGIQTDLSYRFTHAESWPIAALVEWGPFMTLAIILMGGTWVVRTWREADETAKRIALIGVVAVVLQNLADFNWEFLGVMAPTIALAGSITRRGRPFARRRVLGTAAGVLGVASAVALWSGPRAWSSVRDLPERVAEGEVEAEVALGWRVLDTRLHVDEARRAFEAGDHEGARRHASAARSFAPWSMDALLILGALADAEDPGTADDHFAEALANVRGPLLPETAAWLASRRSPEELAKLLPDDDPHWTWCIAGFIEADPRLADAIASASDSPERTAAASLARARSNAKMQRWGLMLHHARLAHQAAPERAAVVTVYLEAVRKTEADPDAAERRVAEVLSGALEAELDDRAIVLEAVVINALNLGTPEALEHARSIVGELVAAPASDDVRARRRALAERLSQTRSRR